MAKKVEEKLTEQQWIAKMKKAGFELYKTKDLKPKLNAFYKIQDVIVGTLDK
jgi:hypothetical protein